MAFDFRKLSRCNAKARSNEGKPCRQAAMVNGRCHWHGGSVPIKHGHYTKKSQQACFEQRQIINQMRNTVISLKSIINNKEQHGSKKK